MDLLNHLETLKNGLRYVQSDERKAGMTNGRKLKSTIPFSEELNNFITNWYNQHRHIFVFTDTDDFDENDIEGTFEKHKQRYKETGKIHIWTGCSDNTIFGYAHVNHKFRAWHDYIHITENYGYDFVGESTVATIQAQQLPDYMIFEKELVLCEVVGQAQHFMKFNSFVNDQRLFTVRYLTLGCSITLQKQH